MKCYKIRVKTTNAQNDIFKLNGEYYDCIDSIVYVFAKSINEASEPFGDTATSVELAGEAFVQDTE